MSKAFCKFLSISFKWKNKTAGWLLVLIFAGCSLLPERAVVKPEPRTQKALDFEAGKNYLLINQYEKAEPLLVKEALKGSLPESIESMLYLAVIYDQITQPEKSILYARDFIAQSKEKMSLLQAHALLLKNLAKVGVAIEAHDSKQAMANIIGTGAYDANIMLNQLKWAFDFNCQVYCVEEIVFLKEIQGQVLYILEKDSAVFARVSDLLVAKYDYFQSYLADHKLNIGYRRRIADSLYDALQKLKSYHLEDNTVSSVNTASVLMKLSSYQKRIEQWIYDNQ